MNNEKKDTFKRGYVLRRSILDYGMGVLITGFGLFLILANKLNYNLTLDEQLRYALGGLFIVYGAFRFYRGYQKKYFESDEE
jgi:hypothetical protein